jgi:hypothetical protein
MEWLKILREQDGAPGAPPSLGERIRAMAGNEPNSVFSVTSDNQDAAADKDDAGDTDLQGNQGEDDDTDGPDSASDEDDQDADLDEGEDEDADESTDQGPDEAGEGNKPKRLSMEERIAEAVDKRVKEVLTAQAEERHQEVPDFAPPDTVKAVKRNIIKWQAEIKELESEIDLEGDDVDDAKIDELLKKQKTVTQALAALDENEARRVAWENRRTQQAHELDEGTAARKRLDDTAEVYRKEMKIEEPSWLKMGEWFKNIVTTNELVNREFNDSYRRGGDVAAIRFAHEYTLKHMGQKTKEKSIQREESKNRAAGATNASGGKVANVQLEELRKACRADPSQVNFMRLQAAKRKAAA